MSSTIIIKNSVTTGSSPSGLETGEFAINVADGNLFYGSGSDVKQNIALGQLSLGGFSDISASLASALVNADDLGNHTATQDLNMAGFNIDAAKEITASGNISASGDIHSEYLYVGDADHAHIADRFLNIQSDSSVYFRMQSNTNGNSIIEFHNTQEPDFLIGSFFNVGGIQIRSEDKHYAKFGESGSAHQIELSGSVGITGLAAELNVAGDGNFTGSLTAAVKSFSIPHKTHKGKKLVYGVLEGPEHSVYVRGRVKEKQIDLPEEWTWLVDEDSITVQLTPIGKGQSLYVKEISNSRIFIENDAMFSSKIDAYYTIHATRKDVKKLKTVQ